MKRAKGDSTEKYVTIYSPITGKTEIIRKAIEKVFLNINATARHTPQDAERGGRVKFTAQSRDRGRGTSERYNR